MPILSLSLMAVPFVQSRWPASLAGRGPEGRHRCDSFPGGLPCTWQSPADGSLPSCWGPAEGRTQLSLPCTVLPPGGKRLLSPSGPPGSPAGPPATGSYLLCCCSLEPLGPDGVTASQFQATLTCLVPCHQQTQNHSTTDGTSGAAGTMRHAKNKKVLKSCLWLGFSCGCRP